MNGSIYNNKYITIYGKKKNGDDIFGESFDVH